MNQLSIADKYVARLLMVSFVLPMKWQVWAVMAVSVWFVFRAIQMKQPIPRSSYIWAFVLSSGYLLYLLSFPLTSPEYKKMLSALCERKVSFILMPVVFAIISPAFGTLIRRQLIWFVYGCFIACIAANMAVFYQYYSAHGTLHSLTHVIYRTNIHMLTDIHPTYLAMYLAFSICILLFTDELTGRAGQAFKYILLYLMFIFFLALLAKSPLLALVAIFVHAAYVHRRALGQYKVHFAGLLVAVALAWFFIPFFSQRVGETLQFFGDGKRGNVADNSVYARKLILGIDKDLLRDYWITGVGPGRLQGELHMRYFFYSLGSDFPAKYNDPHSQYLYDWLSFGLLGLVVFAGIYMMYLVNALRQRDHLYLYFLLILYITFFTETVLSQQRGIMFYAVFTSMMFFTRPPGQRSLPQN